MPIFYSVCSVMDAIYKLNLEAAVYGSTSNGYVVPSLKLTIDEHTVTILGNELNFLELQAGILNLGKDCSFGEKIPELIVNQQYAKRMGLKETTYKNYTNDPELVDLAFELWLSSHNNKLYEHTPGSKIYPNREKDPALKKSLEYLAEERAKNQYDVKRLPIQKITLKEIKPPKDSGCLLI